MEQINSVIGIQLKKLSSSTKLMAICIAFENRQKQSFLNVFEAS